MKKTIKLTMMVMAGLLLAGCGAEKPKMVQEAVPTEAIPTVDIVTEVPTDINYNFLIELTKNTKIAFGTPIKADIIWTEGETVDSRRTFFGDSYLIEYSNPTAEDEKTVESYFKDNGFNYMKFNESKGEGSHKVGYRKDNLVCKYERDKYPGESVPHLNVYCTDASKGTERK